MSASPRDDLLVWIDLEMSGLDHRRERILELAILVTDSQLELVAEGPQLVIHQDDALLDAMDEWNTEHHGASGLTASVRASELGEEAAEEQVLAFLAPLCKPGTAPLAGNSVWMDRLFLKSYMRRLDEFLHYRIVDVSTIKELARRWRPEVLERAPPKKEAHRALDDIRESIAELAWYRRELFAAP